MQLAYWKKVRQIQHELYCYLLTSLDSIVVVHVWILILKMYKLIKIFFIAENRRTASITYKVCEKVYIYTKVHSLLSYIASCTQLLYYEIPSIISITNIK